MNTTKRNFFFQIKFSRTKFSVNPKEICWRDSKVVPLEAVIAMNLALSSCFLWSQAHYLHLS